MTQEFTIRTAERKDAGTILELIRELAAYEKLEHEAVATPELLEKWLFDEKKAEVLIGEESGRTVGFALFYTTFSTFLGKPGLYLEDLFVRPETRGKGYGKQLLAKLARLVIERDYGRLEWWCLDWNKPSIQFYLANGAVPMNDWTVYRLTGPQLQALAES